MWITFAQRAVMRHFGERDRIAFAFRAIAKTVKYDERQWTLLIQMTAPWLVIGFPVIRTFSHARIGPFHPALRPVERNEAEFSIQSVCIFCRQDPAAKPLQVGLRQYHFH